MKIGLKFTALPERLRFYVGYNRTFDNLPALTESDLGFDESYNVKAYISPNIDNHYYALVTYHSGYEITVGEMDEMQKWVTETVYKYCKKQEVQKTKGYEI